MSLENGEESCDDYEKPIQVRSFTDNIRKNYTERPLLPLKPLQKQRSRSCSNLVQTIKGFSIKKMSANRYSSPEFREKEFSDKREICTSGANISMDSGTKDSRVEEETVRRISDSTELLGNKNFAWYHPIDAREASRKLLRMRQTGAFLIRPASNPTPEIFHTLCVVLSTRVYNFHIRNLKNGRLSLGDRKGTETFPSILEMIKYHQTVPISIYLSETGQKAQVYLLITPSK